MRWVEQQVDLQQILAAQEIWKTGSITRAAKNLFMGQPNLSRSLQELEEEVGFPIFDRSSRGVRPTVEGLTFLHRSQEVVQAMDSLRQIYGSEKREPVRILIPQVFYAVGCLADFLAQEARKSPISGGSLPHLNMEQVPADQIEERVGRSEQTLGIVRFEEGRKHILYDRWRRQGLIWKELMRFPTRVTLSKQHPLAKRETLQPQELYPYTELRGQYDHISRPELEKNERKVLTIPDRLDQLQMLSQVPGSYLWTGPMPEKVQHLYGLCQRSVEGAVICQDVVLMRDPRFLPMFTRKWMQYLRVWLPQNMKDTEFLGKKSEVEWPGEGKSGKEKNNGQ